MLFEKKKKDIFCFDIRYCYLRIRELSYYKIKVFKTVGFHFFKLCYKTQTINSKINLQSFFCLNDNIKCLVNPKSRLEILTCSLTKLLYFSIKKNMLIITGFFLRLSQIPKQNTFFKTVAKYLQ